MSVDNFVDFVGFFCVFEGFKDFYVFFCEDFVDFFLCFCEF